MRLALVAAALALVACKSDAPPSHTLHVHGGVLRWQDKDTTPNTFFNLVGDFDVEMSDGWVYASKDGKEYAIPQHRIVHIASGDDPMK